MARKMGKSELATLGGILGLPGSLPFESSMQVYTYIRTCNLAFHGSSPSV